MAGQQVTPSEAGPNHLRGLPAEILHQIYSHLSNRELKSLRLQNSFFRDTAHLRLDRVFLSANPRDVDVFRAVADHDTLRKGVTTIIWDDAVVVMPPEEDIADGIYEDPETLRDNQIEEELNGYPPWFEQACEDNLFELNSRYQYDLEDRPDRIIATQMGLAECWAYLQQLRTDQQDTIARGADAAALRHGLERFTSLRCIRVTPATHGFMPWFPLYETPTIRARPPGLNYPPPRGWQEKRDDERDPDLEPWLDEDGGTERRRNKWRGVRIIVRVLAEWLDEQPSRERVVELGFDSHELETGVSCRLFDRADGNADYQNLVKVLRQPGFQRLDLSLYVTGQEHDGWPTFRRPHLKAALQELGHDFRHMSLTTEFRGWGYSNYWEPPPMEDHIPLRTIFPIECWPNLRHFGLSGFLITQEDFMGFLRAMPRTLRTLFLSDLFPMREKTESWASLLNEMRDGLSWQSRPKHEQPRVSIRVREIMGHTRAGRSTWVKHSAMEAFFYGRGRNPFGGDDGSSPMTFGKRSLLVVRDAFDPGFERPVLFDDELKEQGYIKQYNQGPRRLI